MNIDLFGRLALFDWADLNERLQEGSLSAYQYFLLDLLRFFQAKVIAKVIEAVIDNFLIIDAHQLNLFFNFWLNKQTGRSSLSFLDQLEFLKQLRYSCHFW